MASSIVPSYTLCASPAMIRVHLKHVMEYRYVLSTPSMLFAHILLCTVYIYPLLMTEDPLCPLCVSFIGIFYWYVLSMRRACMPYPHLLAISTSAAVCAEHVHMWLHYVPYPPSLTVNAASAVYDAKHVQYGAILHPPSLVVHDVACVEHVHIYMGLHVYPPSLTVNTVCAEHVCVCVCVCVWLHCIL